MFENLNWVNVNWVTWLLSGVALWLVFILFVFVIVKMRQARKAKEEVKAEIEAKKERAEK